jgi:hypothetical protein
VPVYSLGRHISVFLSDRKPTENDVSNAAYTLSPYYTSDVTVNTIFTSYGSKSTVPFVAAQLKYPQSIAYICAPNDTRNNITNSFIINNSSGLTNKTLYLYLTTTGTGSYNVIDLTNAIDTLGGNIDERYKIPFKSSIHLNYIRI